MNNKKKLVDSHLITPKKKRISACNNCIQIQTISMSVQNIAIIMSQAKQNECKHTHKKKTGLGVRIVTHNNLYNEL